MRALSSLRVGRLCLASAALGLFVWACSSSSDEEKLRAAKLAEGCALNSECENPLVCTFERCHKECALDRDCPGEQRCVKGAAGFVCQLDDETACKANRDCKGDQVCGVDGECRDECDKDTDCTNGQLCAKSGECASSSTDKDSVDSDGNIRPDNLGAGGSNAGTSGQAGANAGGQGGSGAVGGSGTGVGGTGEGGTDSGCPKGKGNCDANPDCETDLSLITSCGSCDTVCDASHGKIRCDADALKCIVDAALGGCDQGFDDCDENADNGCEVELSKDPANCGACGKSCGGGTCAAGKCGPAVVMDPPGDQHFSYTEGFLIGDRLVAVSVAQGWSMRSLALTGATLPAEGASLLSFASGQTRISAVTFDDTYAYAAQSANPSSILRKNLDGSGTTQETFSSTRYPHSQGLLRLYSKAFFFVTYDGKYDFWTVPKSGGTPSQIPGLEDRGAIYDMIVTASRLYWIEYSEAKYALFSAPASGGEAAKLDPDVGGYNQVKLVTDATHVYWNVAAASGKIRRIPHDGKKTDVQDVAVGVTYPREGLAVDETYVYFWDQQNYSNVWRVKKDGTEETKLISNLNSPPYFYRLFAVDAGFVYGVGANGQIVRIAKAP